MIISFSISPVNLFLYLFFIFLIIFNTYRQIYNVPSYFHSSMVYIILTAPVACPARSDRVASSYWQPSNHSGCFIFITAIRFFFAAYTPRNILHVFSSVSCFSSPVRNFCFHFYFIRFVSMLYMAEKIYYSNKNTSYSSIFLYRKFYITLSYLCQYYPLAIPGFSLYAWMCGK